MKEIVKTEVVKNVKAVLLLLLAGFVLSAAGCDFLGLTDDDDGGSGGGDGDSETFTRDLPAVFFQERDYHGKVSFDLDIDQDVEVYFIFTNTTVDEQKSAPSLLSGSVPPPQADPRFFGSQAAPAPNRPRLPDNPFVQKFNRNPEQFITQDIFRSAVPSTQSYPAPQMSYQVGNKEDFYISSKETITAELRRVDSGTGYRLLIWEENESNIADKYLDTIEQDFATIFPLTINMFGPHWGSAHNSSWFIGDTDDIHILYYDMDSYSGYFWGLNNYKKTTEIEGSNEKIMFYMDVEGAGRDYSTLAHEFQHLINFYQKTLLNADSTETWFNEMMSMATEDLLADKKPNPGPRGVGLDDESFRYLAQGDFLQSTSWPSEYLYNTNTPLTVWLEGDDVFRSYSTAYVFGAFLLRNYGGAELLHELMQNNTVDEQSVVNAVNKLNGSSLTFADILRRWGVAVLLSDSTAPLPQAIGSGYNSGSALDSTFNSQQYKLGSMDLHLYKHYNWETEKWSDVLRVFSLGDYPSNIKQAANIFAYAGGVSAGQAESWEFDVPAGVSVTALIRSGD